MITSPLCLALSLTKVNNVLSTQIAGTVMSAGLAMGLTQQLTAESNCPHTNVFVQPDHDLQSLGYTQINVTNLQFWLKNYQAK
jgi:hypothetical protein